MCVFLRCKRGGMNGKQKYLDFREIITTFADFLWDGPTGKLFKTHCIMAEYLQPEKKQEIFAKYGKSNKDTGSPESQVALFSYRIAHLTEHVKKNKKDVVTRRSLLRLVSKRRQLLNYLQNVDIERYRAIVKELGLRR